MLPRVVPKARIMRYGYESQWFGEDTISLKASTVAQRLLRALNRSRKGDCSRPLIFVAHCFGGLVILKAIVDAKRSDDKGPGIYKSTTGMLFFGTPFRGAGGLNQVELIKAIQSQYEDDRVRESSLNILAPGNESLMDLMDLLFETRQGQNISRVACFFEQKPSDIGKIYGGSHMEFNQSEATEKFSLSRNHFNMNKFGKPEEEDFETVCEVVESMVHQAPALICARDQEFGDYQVPFRLTGLPVSGNFVDRDLEMNQIEHSLHPELQNGRRIHVLHGLGGIGKTQLAIAYARRFRKRYSAVLWLNGNSCDTLLQSFSSFAMHAGIRSIPNSQVRNVLHDQETPDNAKAAVLRWLARDGNREWLMIFDNVDRDHHAETNDPQSYDIESFFPEADCGSILVTTRLSRLGQLGTQSGLTTVSDEQASRIFASHSGLPPNAPDLDRLLKKLMGLPLALVQAGRYIRETGTTCQRYLFLYETSWSELQADIPRIRDYPNHSIQTTLSISYEAVMRSNASAAKLLQLWAYLDHQDLWFGLLNNSLEDPSLEAPDWFQQVSQNETTFLRVIRTLLDFSLVNAHQDTGSYSIHPVVHSWCLESIGRGNVDLKTLAITIVGRATPDQSTPECWVIERRLLPHANRCIQHVPVSGSPRAKDYSKALHQVGILYYNVFRVAEAAVVLTRALSEKEEAYGPEHSITLETARVLGSVYVEQRRLPEAEDLLQRALTVTERILGPEHDETLKIVKELAYFYAKQSRIVDAEALYLRALSAFEKGRGSENILTIYTAQRLGGLYVAQHRFTEAEEMYKRALRGKSKEKGIHFVAQMRTVSSLAYIYEKQGNVAKAEEMYQKALNGMENELGFENRQTLAIAIILGRFYIEQRRMTEAEKLLLRAVSGLEKTLGAEDSLTLCAVFHLGELYESQCKTAEAEEMYQRVLCVREKTLGSEHLSTLVVIAHLALLYLNQGRRVEAKEMYQRVLNGYLNREGANDTDINRVLGVLDLDQLSRGDEQEQESRSMKESSIGDKMSHFWTRLLYGKSDQPSPAP